MILPDIVKASGSAYNAAQTVKKIIEFKGLNFNPVISNGEFSTMTNLSARNYPCLSPRAQRSVYNAGASGISFMIAVGSTGVLAWVQTGSFYYNGISKGVLDSIYNSGARQLVEFQDRILIWPDKMYYDITDDKLSHLEASVSFSGLAFAASTEDTALGNAVKYSSIVSSGSFLQFNEGDSIKISGCALEGNNRSATIDHISSDKKTLWFFENTFGAATESGSVTLSRSIPDMDYICVANNRVWGCRDSSIYGSKLGSAENFYSFQSIAGDSYTIDVTSGGKFTGCHAYGSYVVFFKEDVLHKLIGNKPTNYQLSQVICPGLGLESGGVNSFAYLSSILYFKSRMGIVGFNGGAPFLLSARLGDKTFHDAVACTDGRCYYVSMTDGIAYSLFVYDSFHDVWHKEDDTRVLSFGVMVGKVYMLTGTGRIMRLEDASDGESVAWSGTFGEFTENSTEQKVTSRFRMRVELSAGATLKVEYNADGRGYVTAWEGAGYKRGGFYISVLPESFDSLVLRLSGKGDCKIYQIDRIFAPGTDMR